MKKLASLSSENRAIAIDCGSMDYLDTQELHDAFKNGMTNGKKFDIFACDACLMNMIEVAYEMRDTADLMVGSEEKEPLSGWPYEAILGRLVAQPNITPEDLAKMIVIEYGKSYENSGEQVTQSALDLRNIIQMAKSVDDLSSALLDKMKEVAKDIAWSRLTSQEFDTPEYIDLGDFAHNIAQNLSQYENIRNAAEQVQSTVNNSFVMQNVAIGYNMVGAKGVSIYFPSKMRDYAPDYGELLFTADRQWDKLLKEYFDEIG